jgi:mercuric ion transport protein
MQQKLTKALAVGGLTAALAASTCCVLPLSLGAVGVGGAWLSTFSFLAPYQTGIRVVAILLLSSAFWLVYGRHHVTDNGAACAVTPVQRTTKVVLWVAAVLMGLVLSSGWWGQFVA